jgi:hypothetical protein
MTTRSRSQLAGALLAVSIAVPLSAAGPASADLVPVPQPPTVDTACLNLDPVAALQCELAILQGAVPPVPQPPLPTLGGTNGTTATSTTGSGSTPTASGGTRQQTSTGHPAATTKKQKKHYRLHRARHHRRH